MRVMMLATAAVAALALGACGRNDAAEQQAAAPVAPADVAAPEAPPAPEPATPEEAVQAAKVVESAPAPVTYDFDEAGAQVDAAEDAGGGLRLREGKRTFFYRTGEQTPYLVREGDYDYAYRNGQLSGVMDRQGKRVAEAMMAARQKEAAAALVRARALRKIADARAPDHRGDGRPDVKPAPGRGDTAGRDDDHRDDNDHRDGDRNDNRGDDRASGRDSDRPSGDRNTRSDDDRRGRPTASVDANHNGVPDDREQPRRPGV